MKLLHRSLLAVSVSLACSQAFAAGFQLNSQSASGIGRAFSGDAVIADNASVLARNPAAMALFDSAALSVGFAYADIDVDVEDVNFANGAVDLGGTNDAGDGKLIPNIYYIQPLNDKWAFGLAAFSNYGTSTDPSDISEGITVAPFDLLGNTEVLTVNFNASVSYRINEMFSVGFGVDAIYGEGQLERNANGMKLIDVDADGWAFGGVVGATLELDENNRFGFSYRFSPDVDVEGDVNAISSQAIPGLENSAVAIAYDDLEVPLADIYQFAGFHQLTDKFAMHYTAQYTKWSSFEQITGQDGSVTVADGPNAGTTLPGTIDSALKTYQWDDSWLFSIGGTYQINETFTVRAGYLFDKSVVDQIDSISIPDSDRQWYTAGLGVKLTDKSSIDFAIAIVSGEEVTLEEESQIVGTVNAMTDSNAIYYALQYNYSF